MLSVYSRTPLYRMAKFPGFHPGQRGIRNNGYREQMCDLRRRTLISRSAKSALLEDGTARISAKPSIQLSLPCWSIMGNEWSDFSLHRVSLHASLFTPSSLLSSRPRFLALPLSPFRYSFSGSYRGIRFSRPTLYWDRGGHILEHHTNPKPSFFRPNRLNCMKI